MRCAVAAGRSTTSDQSGGRRSGRGRASPRPCARRGGGPRRCGGSRSRPSRRRACHSGQRKSGVQMPILMFTCGRGMPWAAHMRRKRNSRTERTAAGSTDPARTRRSFAFPRRRGRAITSAASGAGGMWRRTWACSKALNSSLREATAARSSSVRIGVVTGIPRCVVTCAAGSRWRWTRMPSRFGRPGCRRDGHLGHSSAPQHPPQRRGRRVAEHRAVAQREHAGVPRRLTLRRARSPARKRRYDAGSANRPRSATWISSRGSAPARATGASVTLPCCRAASAARPRVSSRSPIRRIEATFVGGSPP